MLWDLESTRHISQAVETGCEVWSGTYQIRKDYDTSMGPRMNRSDREMGKITRVLQQRLGNCLAELWGMRVGHEVKKVIRFILC